MWLHPRAGYGPHGGPALGALLARRLRLGPKGSVRSACALHGLASEPHGASMRGLVGREDEQAVLGAIEGGFGSDGIAHVEKARNGLRALGDRAKRQRVELGH